MTRLLLVIAILFSVIQLDAQGFAWGIKGGFTLGTQNWNGFERDPLIKYHGILFIESLSFNCYLSCSCLDCHRPGVTEYPGNGI